MRRSRAAPALREAAPPPPDGAPSGGSADTAALIELLGSVEDIRAEAQTLARAAKAVLATVEEGSENSTAALFEAITEAEAVRLERPLHEMVSELEAPGRKSPLLKAEQGDEIRAMINSLKEAYRHWPHNDVDPLVAVRAAKVAVAALDEAVVHAARLTLPHRLDQTLENQQVGDVIDFNREFADELPAEERRKDVLAWLADHPRRFGGLMDVESGLIYRTAQTTRERGWRWALLLVAPLLWILALCLVSRADEWIGIQGNWPLPNFGKLLALFVLAALGALVHFGAEQLKEIRYEARDIKVYVPARGLRWLELRSGGIALLYAPIVVTALALAATGFDPAQGENAVTAILAGYSADSIAPAVSEKLKDAANTRSKAIKKRIGIAGK